MGTLSEDVSLCMTLCLAAALCYLKGRGFVGDALSSTEWEGASV